MAGWPGIYLAEIARLVPVDRVSMATGGLVACSFLGVVAGPALFSTIVAATGSYTPAFALFGSAAGIAGATLWLRGRDAAEAN
jgi:hypothetical protein